MPWQCFMSQSKDDRKTPGSMWYDPSNPAAIVALVDEINVSTDFKRDWLGKRNPLYVCLPDGQPFCLDWPASGRTDNHGWMVTGEAPNVTVTPSINHNSRDRVHGWHGYITNGVVSDDLEGRTYEAKEV